MRGTASVRRQAGEEVPEIALDAESLAEADFLLLEDPGERALVRDHGGLATDTGDWRRKGAGAT